MITIGVPQQGQNSFLSVLKSSGYANLTANLENIEKIWYTACFSATSNFGGRL